MPNGLYDLMLDPPILLDLEYSGFEPKKMLLDQVLKLSRQKRLEVDVEAGHYSAVDEYFVALERSVLEQVQLVLNQRSTGL